MTTFAQCQKLSKHQMPLKPQNTKRSRRNKNTNKPPKFNFWRLFNLPLEVIDLIFSRKNLDYARTHIISRLRLINKATKLLVDNFCEVKCRNITLIPNIIPLKFYFNRVVYNDINILDKSVIYYNNVIKCDRCNRNKYGLFTKLNDKYICAFECRRYYCINTDCNDYGDVYTISPKNTKCDGCEDTLVLHVKGIRLDPWHSWDPNIILF